MRQKYTASQKVMFVISSIIAILVVAMIVAFDKPKDKVNSNPTRDAEMAEIKLQRLAREFVTGALKDPASAQFRNQRGTCGEVNAKNSFGGYGGYIRFIAAGENLVFMENDPNLARGAFQESWERFCR